MILSDVIMPRLGGIALVKALRKDGAATSVILMSCLPGNSSSDHRSPGAGSVMVKRLPWPGAL